MLGDKTMLAHVVECARSVRFSGRECTVAVSTDDERIGVVCDSLEVPWALTSPPARNGSESAGRLIEMLSLQPDVVCNLQGDAPFIDPKVIEACLTVLSQSPEKGVVTPIVPLLWNNHRKLIERKKSNPFSGTYTVQLCDGSLAWFSKNPFPAVRSHDALLVETSPFFRHIGIYCYRRETLATYCQLPVSHYEELEGLEQLRFLENKIPIYSAQIDPTWVKAPSGIDSPEDLAQIAEIMGLSYELP
jgi:3-deoxy-manno-octulosonate cytidylyltransferase (CMP-KDO synthetase)